MFETWRSTPANVGHEADEFFWVAALETEQSNKNDSKPQISKEAGGRTVGVHQLHLRVFGVFRVFFFVFLLHRGEDGLAKARRSRRPSTSRRPAASPPPEEASCNWKKTCSSLRRLTKHEKKNIHELVEAALLSGNELKGRNGVCVSMLSFFKPVTLSIPSSLRRRPVC